MKIRTRLLLSLLPTFLGSIGLIATLLYYRQMNLAIFGIVLLIVIAIASLYYMAGKISAPVQKLNDSALTIAAGEYGESIQAQGPKELQELANTLNTMSQCLLENINRLKQNSLHREKRSGETECARLLQNLMLQKNIDECASESIAVKAVSFFSASPRGLLIDFPHSDCREMFTVHMAEAKLDGFDGIYHLLTQYKLSKEHPQEKLPFPSIRLTFNRETSSIVARSCGCASPYLWSISASELHELKGKHPLEAGDLIILMNRGFVSFFKNPSKIADLLTKVLKHFAQDGLDTTAAMLHKEISFAIKRKDFIDDLHLLCIQILQPTYIN